MLKVIKNQSLRRKGFLGTLVLKADITSSHPQSAHVHTVQEMTSPLSCHSCDAFKYLPVLSMPLSGSDFLTL